MRDSSESDESEIKKSCFIRLKREGKRQSQWSVDGNDRRVVSWRLKILWAVSDTPPIKHFFSIWAFIVQAVTCRIKREIRFFYKWKRQYHLNTLSSWICKTTLSTRISMNLTIHRMRRIRKRFKKGKSWSIELRDDWIANSGGKSTWSCCIEFTCILTHTFEMCTEKRHFHEGNTYIRIDSIRKALIWRHIVKMSLHFSITTS